MKRMLIAVVASLVLASAAHATTIQVVNRSRVPDRVVQRIVMAVDREANGAFRRAWLAGHRVRVTTESVAGAWKLYVIPSVLATCGEGRMGCHSIFDGRPVSWADPRDSLAFAISHEALEMLADPYLNRVAPNGDLAEVCDPVYNDDAYLPGSSLGVSDWVYPRWFGYRDVRSHAAAARYDFAGDVHRAGAHPDGTVTLPFS